MTGGPAVSWQNVWHAYRRDDVVRDVSLTVGPGECVALLGANGAGKTTLTRMIMGLVRPRSGVVRVGDWDVARRRPDEMAQRVGYAFQHADQQLFAGSVREDVAFGPRRLGKGVSAVDPVLAELALEPVARRHPYDLPVPLRKVVALAGVLAMEPGVLVLDEPTAGFDRPLRALVVAALRRRHLEGLTIIMVSHDLELVRELARRRIVLERGAVASDTGFSPIP